MKTLFIALFALFSQNASASLLCRSLPSAGFQAAHAVSFSDVFSANGGSFRSVEGILENRLPKVLPNLVVVGSASQEMRTLLDLRIVNKVTGESSGRLTATAKPSDLMNTGFELPYSGELSLKGLNDGRPVRVVCGYQGRR